MEKQLAADIESVISDKTVLKEPITEARRAKIQDEQAQPEIADLLDNHDPLSRLCEYEYKQAVVEDMDSIVPVSEQLLDDGHIDTATHEEFIDLWDEIDWIVPAVGIQIKNLGGLEQHWSDIEMNPRGDRPAIMDYTMRWGVDEQIDAEVPGARVIERSLKELDIISNYLQFYQDSPEVDDETVSYLAEQYDINWATDMLREVLSDLEDIDHSTEGQSKPTADPNLQIVWDNSIGQDDVVGKIEIKQPSEKVSESDDGGSDAPPRGFQ
jgi:hypothetical protein